MHDDNEMHNLRERTMSTNTKNIVLVHDGWADGSSRSKEIPILKNAEHQLITVQLVEHSLADDPDVQRRRKQHSCVPQHPRLLARL